VMAGNTLVYRVLRLVVMIADAKRRTVSAAQLATGLHGAQNVTRKAPE